jgi:hypothetical protein
MTQEPIVVDSETKGNIPLTYEDLRVSFNDLTVGHHTRIAFVTKVIDRKLPVNHKTILNFFNRTMNRLPQHPFDINLINNDIVINKKRNMSPQEVEVISIPEEVWKKAQYQEKYNVKVD